MEIWVYVAIIIVGFIVLEAIFRYLIFKVNRGFQWLILQKDEYPKLPLKELEKFFEHGYDQELGWVRKPNTEHNEIGKNSRVTKWTKPIPPPIHKYLAALVFSFPSILPY